MNTVSNGSDVPSTPSVLRTNESAWADRLHEGHERRGCVEIRWTDDGDPDDVVAPWPRSLDGEPILVHIERMSDGHIWLAIYDHNRDVDVHMDFTAKKKGELGWFVRPS